MIISEAVAFIAALSRRDGDLCSREADELMDEMNVSEELRELVVADVVGGQYHCAECFPDGCRLRRADSTAPMGKACQGNAEWSEKERCAQDVWDQPVSRIALIHEIAKAQGQEGEL
jgi:hypothetical protein